LDHGAEDRRLRLEQRRGPRNCDGFADQSDFERKVNLRSLIDLQLYARALDFTKTLNLGGELVETRLQRSKNVGAPGASCSCAGDAGGLVCQRNRNARHYASGTVSNR